MTKRTKRNRRFTVESLEGRALMTAGALDTSFGGTGMVSTQIGSGTSDSSYDTIVQPNNKVIVAGRSFNSSGTAYLLTLVRYNADGTLDSTFGSKGIAQISVGNDPPGSGLYAGDNAPVGVALQGDGKIVVASGSVALVSGTYHYYTVVERVLPL